MDIRRIGSVKNGEEVVGNRTRVRMVKNKVAPPFREAEVDIIFGKGISRLGEIVDLGLKYNILSRSGTWFSYGEERLGQGRDNSKNFLIENPDIRNEIVSKILEASGILNKGEPEGENDNEQGKDQS